MWRKNCPCGLCWTSHPHVLCGRRNQNGQFLICSGSLERLTGDFRCHASVLLGAHVLFQPNPGQFVLVARKMDNPGARKCGKPRNGLMICFSLEFEGTDKVTAGAKFQPAGNNFVQLVRITDHIGKEPVNRTGMPRIQGKPAADAVCHLGHMFNVRSQRRLVDTKHTGSD